MRARYVFLALAGILLAATPSLAQRHDAGRRGDTHQTPQTFHGGARGPAQWNQFHHDTAPARILPHRFGATNFPHPNRWAGDIRRFDLPLWRGGHWLHANHAGRFGWWWVVGANWYFFNRPVYPYPDLYTPFGAPFGWWYWCDPYQEYYPFVTYCPAPWESVLPRD